MERTDPQQRQEESYPEVDPWNLPDDVELRFAYHLISRKNPLDRRILYELLGHPKRYSELKHLLQGKRDNNLTVALKRLDENGLVVRFTHLGTDPVIHEYEITDLGILVVLTMERIRPIHQVVEQYLAARPPHPSPPTD